MRVILAGGGTGGHIYPAIAIADTIKKHDKYADILFIATKRGMEKRLVEKAGYKTYHIEMSGLQRSLSPRNIKTAICFVTAPIKAKKLIKEFEPDVVIGTGGYLCWPLLHAAAKLGVPTLVHESNAIPGKAVKMLEKEVDVIAAGFDSIKNTISCPEKFVRTGNPLRSIPSSEEKASVRESLGIGSEYKYVLLSFGGSLGSEKINAAALRLMSDFSSKHPEVLHVHSTGTGYYKEFTDKFAALGLDACPNIKPMEYIHDMTKWETAADAVICRSGAMTVSEMALGGKACIFIPSPNVVANHQFENASRLAQEGAAVVITEKQLTPELLSAAVEQVLFSSKGAELSVNIRKFAEPESAEKIYGEIVRLANRDLLSLVGEDEK